MEQKVAQPHQRGTSRGKRGNNAGAHLKRHGAPSEAVVAVVTNGRLDGSTALGEAFGTWERIL